MSTVNPIDSTTDDSQLKPESLEGAIAGPSGNSSVDPTEQLFKADSNGNDGRLKTRRIDPPHPLRTTAASPTEPAIDSGSTAVSNPSADSPAMNSAMNSIVEQSPACKSAESMLLGVEQAEKWVGEAAVASVGSALPEEARGSATERASDTESQFRQREKVLRLHAEDLIAELQKWAENLDHREMQLNTRDALMDARERQLRGWEKSKRQEIEDATRLTDRLQQEAKERLKRIAALELG